MGSKMTPPNRESDAFKCRCHHTSRKPASLSPGESRSSCTPRGRQRSRATTRHGQLASSRAAPSTIAVPLTTANPPRTTRWPPRAATHRRRRRPWTKRSPAARTAASAASTTAAMEAFPGAAPPQSHRAAASTRQPPGSRPKQSPPRLRCPRRPSHHQGRRRYNHRLVTPRGCAVAALRTSQCSPSRATAAQHGGRPLATLQLPPTPTRRGRAQGAARAPRPHGRRIRQAPCRI
jgi:hypothetical protein